MGDFNLTQPCCRGLGLSLAEKAAGIVTHICSTGVHANAHTHQTAIQSQAGAANSIYVLTRA